MGKYVCNKFVSLRLKGSSNIQVDKETGKLKIEGDETIVELLKFEIVLIISKFTDRFLSERKFSLLNEKSNWRSMQTLLSESKKRAICYVNDRKETSLYAINKDELDQAFDLVNNSIVERKLEKGRMCICYAGHFFNI